MPEKETPEKQNKFQLSDVTKEPFRYLIEIIIPVLIGLFIWYILASTFKFWQYSGTFIALTFVFILVLGSLVVSLLFRRFTGSKDSKQILKIIFSSIFLPFIVSIAANTIPMSDNETILTWTLRQIMGQQEYWYIQNIGDTVIYSNSLEAKLAGINALETIHTEMALIELFRIFEEDPDILGSLGIQGVDKKNLCRPSKSSQSR